jgi:hypothetical protein
MAYMPATEELTAPAPRRSPYHQAASGNRYLAARTRWAMALCSRYRERTTDRGQVTLFEMETHLGKNGKRVTAPSDSSIRVIRDEDQILQISKRLSEMAGEESCDHARIMGRLLQEELTATEHHLARIGG